MGLTSGTFLWLLMTLAAGSVAAIVALWRRLARQRPLEVAARVGMLAVSQFLVIATFLVWLNGYFAFYGSWGQLLGTSHPRMLAPVKAAATATPARALAVYGGQPGPPSGQTVPLAASKGLSGLASPGSPAVAGRLLQIGIHGQRTGLYSGRGYVYLPPQYFQPHYARTRFPVVLSVTGYPGEAGGLVNRFLLPSTAARLIAAGKIKPAVYVMLSVSPLLPLDTECTDIPGGPQVESFFAQDVPHAVEQAFRVTSSPAGWAVMGYSTGGYCAAKLAMMYPDRFSAAVAMAAYYVADKGHGVPNMWGGSLLYRHWNSPDWRLQHLPAPPVSVLATSSRIGERSLPGTLAFLKLVRPPMHAYSLIVPQGGHNFRTWNRELTPSLEWLSARLK